MRRKTRNLRNHSDKSHPLAGIVIPALLLLAALLACALPGSATPEPGTMETSVASTLTALAPDDGTPEVAPPTDTPLPEFVVTPTPTPIPIMRTIYTDAGNIWLLEEGAAALQLTASGGAEDIVISSDGMKIAFLRSVGPDNRQELRSVNYDGSGEALLLSVAEMDALYPLTEGIIGFGVDLMTFRPGTHDLYFGTWAVPEFIGYIVMNDLLKVDTDSGAFEILLAGGDGGRVDISPDGNQMAIIKPDRIGFYDPLTGAHHPNVLPYTPVLTHSEFAYYAQPIWSADSSQLAVAIPFEEPFEPGAGAEMWTLSAPGAPVTHGTSLGNHYMEQQFGTILVSPDHSKIAFTRDSGPINNRDLYIANFDGSGEVLYASGNINWQGWAPDSEHFVYSRDEPMNLRLGRLGSGPIALANGINLSWINATDYYYLSGSFGSWTLMRGHLGGAAAPIAAPAGDFIRYDFVPRP
jgi:hypothetical protein